MQTVYLKKRIEAKFGVTLFPNKAYPAAFCQITGRWMVFPMPNVSISVEINNIQSVK